MFFFDKFAKAGVASLIRHDKMFVYISPMATWFGSTQNI